MLKLASFADLGSNGISDGTPMTTLDLGNCGQCSNKVDNPMNALIWEAMIFCNVTCLGNNNFSLKNISSFLLHAIFASLRAMRPIER